MLSVILWNMLRILAQSASHVLLGSAHSISFFAKSYISLSAQTMRALSTRAAGKRAQQN